MIIFTGGHSGTALVCIDSERVRKKHAKRDVDPPGQIKSRPIDCIDT